MAAKKDVNAASLKGVRKGESDLGRDHVPGRQMRHQGRRDKLVDVVGEVIDRQEQHADSEDATQQTLAKLDQVIEERHFVAVHLGVVLPLLRHHGGAGVCGGQFLAGRPAHRSPPPPHQASDHRSWAASAEDDPTAGVSRSGGGSDGPSGSTGLIFRRAFGGRLHRRPNVLGGAAHVLLDLLHLLHDRFVVEADGGSRPCRFRVRSRPSRG